MTFIPKSFPLEIECLTDQLSIFYVPQQTMKNQKMPHDPYRIHNTLSGSANAIVVEYLNLELYSSNEFDVKFNFKSKDSGEINKSIRLYFRIENVLDSIL